MVSDQSLINTQKGALCRPPTSTNWAQLHRKSKGQRWLHNLLHVLYFQSSIGEERVERGEGSSWRSCQTIRGCSHVSHRVYLFDEVLDCPDACLSLCVLSLGTFRSKNNFQTKERVIIWSELAAAFHTCLLKTTVDAASLHSYYSHERNTLSKTRRSKQPLYPTHYIPTLTILRETTFLVPSTSDYSRTTLLRIIIFISCFILPWWENSNLRK